VFKDYVQKKDSWIARDLVQDIAKQVRQALLEKVTEISR
jgi:hypothetical protein